MLSASIIICIKAIFMKLCSSVAEWLGSRSCDQQVAGSNPSRRAAKCNLGQVVYTVHTRASVTKQYNLVPATGDARRLGR